MVDVLVSATVRLPPVLVPWTRLVVEAPNADHPAPRVTRASVVAPRLDCAAMNPLPPSGYPFATSMACRREGHDPTLVTAPVPALRLVPTHAISSRPVPAHAFAAAARARFRLAGFTL